MLYTIVSFSNKKLPLVSKNDLLSRIVCPEGYTRLTQKTGSFGEWSRKLILKEKGHLVKLYNGELKSRQNVHEAVLDIEVGTKNLQQCADAVIRLRAEYLFSNNKLNDINFHYTSGDLIPFSKWMAGGRPLVKGNKVSWTKTSKKCGDKTCLVNYLFSLYNYAGTISVERETKKISSLNDIQPGDIFVAGGSPGHAVTVLDVAINEKTGKKIFLLCQSYMPAQEIHILKNFNNKNLSPWYETDFDGDLETPEWTFSKSNLRRYE